jgi:putative nucleotidyltransferase with HDIG domain
LGVRNLREVIINLSARQLFESKNAAIRKLTKDLWHHSVAVALIARALTRRRKDVDPEIAYLAGLLHDVGKPVAGALLLELERAIDAPQSSWLSADAWLGVINECHREVGVALARSWHLDEEVLLAIARSDRYAPDNPSSMSSVICYANALAKHAGIAAGPVDTAINDILLRDGEALFKLDAGMVETLLAEMRTQHSDQ